MQKGLAPLVVETVIGTIVFEGTPADLRANQQVTATDLGLGG